MTPLVAILLAGAGLAIAAGPKSSGKKKKVKQEPAPKEPKPGHKYSPVSLAVVKKYWPVILSAAGVLAPQVVAAVTAAATAVTTALAAAAPYVAIVIAVAAAIRAKVKSLKDNWANKDLCDRLAVAWAADVAMRERRLVGREETPTPEWDECWHSKNTDKFKGRASWKPIGGLKVIRRDAPQTTKPTWLGEPGPNKANGGTDYAPVWWIAGPLAIQWDGMLRRPGSGPTASGLAPEAAAICNAAAEALANDTDIATREAAATALARVTAIIKVREQTGGFSTEVTVFGQYPQYFQADPETLQDLVAWLEGLAYDA